MMKLLLTVTKTKCDNENNTTLVAGYPFSTMPFG